eukprot:scaffold3586_cov164-Amphora_coffeaeformis.AAC.19
MVSSNEGLQQKQQVSDAANGAFEMDGDGKVIFLLLNSKHILCNPENCEASQKAGHSFTTGAARSLGTMASRDSAPPPATHTTNEEDRQEAEKLKARLRTNVGAGVATRKVDPVQIAVGAHKYVLIQAEQDGKTEYFVTSKRGAHYHRNAAEPLIFELEQAGYYDIEVTGGGRINLDETYKTISIFGYSYSFGLANHEISKEVILSDPRYKDYEVTWSNDGY